MAIILFKWAACWRRTHPVSFTLCQAFVSSCLSCAQLSSQLHFYHFDRVLLSRFNLINFYLIFSTHIKDEDDFGNGRSRIGGPVATSDSEDNLDDDEPMTMTSKNNNTNNNNNLKIYYNNHQQNSSKKPFKMEIVDF